MDSPQRKFTQDEANEILCRLASVCPYTRYGVVQFTRLERIDGGMDGGQRRSRNDA
jgi:hypothetical protein